MTQGASRSFLAIVYFMLTALPAHAADFASHIKILPTPQPVPPFVYEDERGGQHTFADGRGHYILLNIWATWCGPCVREMPSLNALQAAEPRLAVLPLSEDRTADAVTAFYHAHRLSHLTTALDPQGLAPSALSTRGLPTSLLIDPQGREVARIEGDVDWTSPEAQDFLTSRIRP